MKNRYPQLTTMAQLVKDMHTKYGINYEGEPRILEREEKEFRFAGMHEEVHEFISPQNAGNIEEQFDALIDNMVFTLGTAERMGLLDRIEEGFHRVMECNMNKELGGNEKRNNFSLDLRKPEGWIGPDHSDLVKKVEKPKGLIVLDGPDACGKTTLAEHFQKYYEAEIIHLTWNEELEDNMDTYMLGTLLHACTLSKEKLVIIDRLWMSELIYSEVYRGGTSYPELAEDCLNLIKKYNALQITCILPREIWVKNYKEMCSERDEMYGTDERMNKIYDLYHQCIFGSDSKSDLHSEFLTHIIDDVPLLKRIGCDVYDFTQAQDKKAYTAWMLGKLKSLQK